MLPLLGKGHIMWIDNWYSSCCLFDYLHNWKTMACGTIRQIVSQVRSEMPTCRVDKVSAFRSSPLLCLKYRDTDTHADNSAKQVHSSSAETTKTIVSDQSHSVLRNTIPIWRLLTNRIKCCNHTQMRERQ